MLALAAILTAAAAAPPTGCELAIVGAGPGGVYTAWRLAVDTKTVPPTDICIFERAQRVGGRTFSLYGQGSKGDLTVELGAYRFCGSPNATGADGKSSCAGCEMCMPMMNNLIKGKLALHTAPYQPGGGPSDEEQLIKVVDAEGENHGLARYVERMANETRAAGVRYFMTHEATALQAPAPGDAAGSFTVEIRCTAPSFPARAPSAGCAAGAVTAKKVLLNTPLLPTLRIVSASPSLKPHFEGAKFPAFLRVPHAWRHVKFYVHYDWAWWRTLGHTSGDFNLYGPTPGDNGKWDGIAGCRSPRGPLEMCSSDTLPLEGRYHDGHVRCDDGNVTGMRCRGFIEATYTSDGVHASNVTFFEYYQSNTDPPYVAVDREATADGTELLDQVHERLITKHEAQLKAKGLYAQVRCCRPRPPPATLGYRVRLRRPVELTAEAARAGPRRQADERAALDVGPEEPGLRRRHARDERRDDPGRRLRAGRRGGDGAGEDDPAVQDARPLRRERGFPPGRLGRGLARDGGEHRGQVLWRRAADVDRARHL
eukprot:SAG11_NODE_4552_length_1852_cov_7.759270_1_plen_540_part_00